MRMREEKRTLMHSGIAAAGSAAASAPAAAAATSSRDPFACPRACAAAVRSKRLRPAGGRASLQPVAHTACEGACGLTLPRLHLPVQRTQRLQMLMLIE